MEAVQLEQEVGRRIGVGHPAALTVNDGPQGGLLHELEGRGDGARSDHRGHGPGRVLDGVEGSEEGAAQPGQGEQAHRGLGDDR